MPIDQQRSGRQLFAIAVSLLVFGGGLLTGASARTWAGTDGPDLSPIARTLGTIQESYVDAVDPAKLVHEAIKGMVGSLDPHSTYLDPDSYKALRESTDATYVGAGIAVGTWQGEFRVFHVVPSGPADLAGVVAGDHLLTVDGQDIRTWTTDEVADKVRGPRGTSVVLGLVRDDQHIDAKLVRDQVIEVQAEGEILPEDIGYVRLTNFHDRASGDLERAMQTLDRHGPLKGLVLDLRGNGGGLLEEAAAVADLFLSDGTIVEVEERGGVRTDSFIAHPSAKDRHERMAVLIDGDTASASEIVAGILQDSHRATLVGTPSYGKGSVQRVFEFGDGAALKLTIARYLIGGTHKIADHSGLVPDVAVGTSHGNEDALAQVASAVDVAALAPDERDQLHAAIEALRPSHEPVPPWRPAADRMASDSALEAAWKAVH